MKNVIKGEFIRGVAIYVDDKKRIKAKFCVSVLSNCFSKLCYFFWIRNLSPLTHSNTSFLPTFAASLDKRKE